MSNEPIYLLVRADDIGFCQAANQACMDVFTQGICRSVEVMAPCPWFPQAVKLLQAQPTYDVGVHLTLTSEWENMKWRPLSAATSLVDDDGYFCHTYRRGQHYPERHPFCEIAWTAADVELELRAQIETIRKHLPWASHITTHMGGLRDNPNFQGIVDRLAADYDLAVNVADHGFERWRGFGENNQALTPAEKAAALRQNLAALGPGKWIFVDHPAYDTPETRAIYHIGYENVAIDRQGVVEAWTDPEVLAIIARRQIQLVSYGDVKRGLVA
ncbi:MAG: ChbG/HpnK family deacetylase [Caldilineaceae bacterium]|nr:ChbG/HpnK family deacetylase [Caldilineaceae bacterium]